MRDDIIDTVNADTLEPGDFTKYGEVVSVEEDGPDHVLISTDETDEPIRLEWDTLVDLYGSIVEEI